MSRQNKRDFFYDLSVHFDYWNKIKIFFFRKKFHVPLVIGNPGRVLKKRVSGFDFKKPGYPGRVLGFQNIENKASKMSQIKKK